MKPKIAKLNIVYATVIVALAISIIGTALVKALPFLFPTIGESCREFATIPVHDRTGAVISYSPFPAKTTIEGDSHLTSGQGIVATVIGLSAYVCMLYVCETPCPHDYAVTNSVSDHFVSNSRSA